MLDVTKQFLGASVVHFLNVGLSYAAGRPVHGPRTNLCAVYLVSLLVDTTVGIAILWGWLRIIDHLLKRSGIHSVPSGDYGPPPLRCMLQRWARQTSVFVLATICMKLCIFLVFQLAPAVFLLGDWLLEYVARGNLRYQVVFVMFVYDFMVFSELFVDVQPILTYGIVRFPLFMNAFQFCVIDTFIKFEKKQYCTREKKLLTLPPPAIRKNNANRNTHVATATAAAVTAAFTETTPLLPM